MKKLGLIVLILLFGFKAMQAAEAIDSMSYAFGHQNTLGLMAGKNDLMVSEQDFQDYIRGLEENFRSLTQLSDSSYMLSYMLGGMEAVFITDAASHSQKANQPPFDCIIAGLRKVGNGEISLPADTIEAMKIINSPEYQQGNPSEADRDSACRFFTAYGIMKAYQPGLQQYIDGLSPGTACVENRQAFANGMADIIEAATVPPKSAYEVGRLMALSFNLGSPGSESLDFGSFLAGAKAALGLGKQIIPRDRIEQIIDLKYLKDDETDTGVDDNAFFEKLREYIDRLEIKPFIPYAVDWTVTAATVAPEEASEVSGTFHEVTSKLGIPDRQTIGFLMAQSDDADGTLYKAATSAIKANPLPEGYKWFCSQSDSSHLTVGIMQTSQGFKAEVHEATVDFNSVSEQIFMEWIFSAADTLKWANFTEANIDNHVAVEIDGVFIFAPKVHSQITGGRCSINDITPEEINRLFKNAKEIHNHLPADPTPIEIHPAN